MAIIQILEVHPADAFAEDGLEGCVFTTMPGRFICEPSVAGAEEGFFFLDYIQLLSSTWKFKRMPAPDKEGAYCFFGAKFKTLFK